MKKELQDKAARWLAGLFVALLIWGAIQTLAIMADPPPPPDPVYVRRHLWSVVANVVAALALIAHLWPGRKENREPGRPGQV